MCLFPSSTWISCEEVNDNNNIIIAIPEGFTSTELIIGNRSDFLQPSDTLIKKITIR